MGQVAGQVPHAEGDGVPAFAALDQRELQVGEIAAHGPGGENAHLAQQEHRLRVAHPVGLQQGHAPDGFGAHVRQTQAGVVVFRGDQGPAVQLFADRLVQSLPKSGDVRVSQRHARRLPVPAETLEKPPALE